jgi:hypothetical protein
LLFKEKSKSIFTSIGAMKCFLKRNSCRKDIIKAFQGEKKFFQNITFVQQTVLKIKNSSKTEFKKHAEIRENQFVVEKTYNFLKKSNL